MAFNHKECDQIIIEHKFYSYINTLDWGAHHAYDGIIIIKKELAQNTINAALNMIKKYEIPVKYQNALNYYIRLYELVAKFDKNEHKNFYEFCKLNKFPFGEIGVFHYTE